MKRSVIIVVIVLCIAALVGSLLAQSPTPSTAAGFTWHAELVALDEPGKTVTVKTHVVEDGAKATFERLKSGDKVVLVWSGVDQYASGVRDVRPAGAALQSEDRLTLPANFVSFDAATRFVTFKAQIPDSSLAKLKSIKPGEWVTATSPHGTSSNQTQPIVAIRHFNDLSTTSSD